MRDGFTDVPLSNSEFQVQHPQQEVAPVSGTPPELPPEAIQQELGRVAAEGLPAEAVLDSEAPDGPVEGSDASVSSKSQVPAEQTLPAADSGAGSPPKEPPFGSAAQPEGDDEEPEDAGNEKSEEEPRDKTKTESESGQVDKLATAILRAEDFVTAHQDNDPPTPDQLPTQETMDTFIQVVCNLAGDGGERSIMTREIDLFGQVTLRTTLILPPEDERKTNGGAEPQLNLDLSVMPLWESSSGEPDPYLSYYLERTGPHLNIIKTTGQSQESKPTNDEVLQLLDVVGQVREAADSLSAEVSEPSEPIVPECIHVEGAENTYYTYEDLKQFMADTGTTNNTSLVVPTIDLRQPEYWVRMASDAALQDEEDVPPLDAAAVLQRVADVKDAYERLAACGAVIPPHTHFVVADQLTNQHFLFVASQDVGDWALDDSSLRVSPELMDQNLRVTRALYDYLTSTIEDERCLRDLCKPGQWGTNGELYDLDPWFSSGPDAVLGEFWELSRWVEELAPSPERDELSEQINAQVNRLEAKYLRNQMDE